MAEFGNIHEGHRKRMRDKFLIHGPDVFATYELLEILLYSSVPYKDTNPIAKMLMQKFVSINGVFAASKSELMSIDGVGEKTADFILSIGNFIDCLHGAEKAEEDEIFDDYKATGDYLLNYFENEKERAVYMMLFDTGMRLLKVEKVIAGYDYGSAAVKPAMFINAALRTNATTVIIAHNHPYGPLFPTEADMATNTLISDALTSIGVTLLEHYLFSGRSFVGIMNNIGSAFAQHPILAHFIESKRRHI